MITETRPLVAKSESQEWGDWPQRGTRELWGVKEMFHAIIVVVALEPNASVKTHQTSDLKLVDSTHVKYSSWKLSPPKQIEKEHLMK
jgi:hypothetical protein